MANEKEQARRKPCQNGDGYESSSTDSKSAVTHDTASIMVEPDNDEYQDDGTEDDSDTADGSNPGVEQDLQYNGAQFSDSELTVDLA
ncbi:hypothetical protein TSTA_013260 [Talaromyces stipitatus ATCC 10500]|uniref:Uncharacterized protein n=1 Tax=Talaromyces stipitatus (strain ATCC 10500 / CBS 375.48 / QM 6759 / NRRL 1006) TaxID=441959 RepID=B8MG99_TALSN|nr:uncharacterized protein TSTA_013260 [Talaromyces stipitatus ATCC 10500]EED16219.1 hypothetical protein TSTA_013260 [Talaromyces stipitatus ATCC 10500]